MDEDDMWASAIARMALCLASLIIIVPSTIASFASAPPPGSFGFSIICTLHMSPLEYVDMLEGGVTGMPCV